MINIMSGCSLGYNIVSQGTDNHCLLIDLRSKNITGKDAEFALGQAHITVNKNMVPFDDKSPFVTSGIRVGTAAVTTRGLVEKDIDLIIKISLANSDNAIETGIAKIPNSPIVRIKQKIPIK